MIAVVIVGAAAAGIYLSSPGNASTSTTTDSTSTQANSSSVPPFKMNYNTLTVGYKGGLFDLSFQDVGGKPVQWVVVILSTPVEAALCTGVGYGLQFANCVVAPNGGYTAIPTSPQGFAANTTFTGFATGAGPGSAVVGQNYSVTITAHYTDGTTGNSTYTVQATSG